MGYDYDGPRPTSPITVDARRCLVLLLRAWERYVHERQAYLAWVPARGMPSFYGLWTRGLAHRRREEGVSYYTVSKEGRKWAREHGVTASEILHYSEREQG